MSRRRVWITGAGGLIGSWLVRTAPLDVVTVPLGREQIDLADFQKVEREFKRQQPDLVIHCAALSRSPDCQANPALARLVNVDATAHLAGLAADIPFVFFSTDLVFDGRQGNYDKAGSPEESRQRMIHMPIPDFRTLDNRIDDRLNEIIHRTLARELDKRYASADELLYDLEHYIYHSGYGPTNETMGKFIRELFGQANPTPPPPPPTAIQGTTQLLDEARRYINQ